MNDRDQHNLVRFLLDLAQPDRLERHDRAGARLRGDLLRPFPMANGHQKRGQRAGGAPDTLFPEALPNAPTSEVS